MKDIKKWGWLLLLLAVLENAIIIFLNYKFYAFTFSLALFIIILINHLGINMVIIRKGKQSFLMISLCLIIVYPLLFYFAKPVYTYNEGLDIVVSQYNEKVESIPVFQKNVPVSNTYSLITRFYYYQINVKDSNKLVFYMVNPTSGKVIELEEPYWHPEKY